MKNTFYRPEVIDTEKFEIIISKMHSDLTNISMGYVDENPLSEYVSKLIVDQKELPSNPDMGFWGLADPREMPSDARVDFFYMPTYIAAGIIISCKLNYPYITNRIKGFDEALEKGLLASTGRNFQGHGHDNLDGMIKALNVFITAKAHIFVEKYPEACIEFTKLFKETIQFCEKSLLSGKTKGDWGEDYSVQYKCILQAVDPKCYIKLEEKLKSVLGTYLFVYGTLMKNNRKRSEYLADAKYLGEGTLKGYDLYDLGWYPGIIKGNGMVKGELYAISLDKLPEIDRYEAEGTLYKREKVEVLSDDNMIFNAFTYEYNQSVSNKKKVDYKYQPWYEGIVSKINDDNLVWYAAYGSNVNSQRFMKYILECSDKSEPRKVRPLIIKHPIYFAKNSRRWGSKGVAFLDIEKPGKTYGKIYLITKEQLSEIQEQEGSWYNRIAQLGTYEGIPIKTITHDTRYSQDVTPCAAYTDVIKKGIKDTYPNLTDEDIDIYVLEACLNSDMLEILKYLRKQEHGVEVSRICSSLNKQDKLLIGSIDRLRDLGLIIQDSRSIRAGVPWNSGEAVYYTVRNKRNTIDSIVNR